MSRNSKEYIPGVCNIDTKGTNRRARLAVTGIVLSFLYAIIIYYFSLDRIWRLGLFFPAFLAALNILQVRMRFCVLRGFNGESEFGNKKIQHHNLDTDRKRAVKIILYAIIIAAFATAIVYYFPI